MTAQSNLLVPPHPGFVDRMVRFVIDREDILDKMSTAKKLYGENVGIKIVQKIRKLHDEGLSMMRTVPEVMGLLDKSSIDFL